MKLRNFVIVLLALLTVFAIAACKNDPKDPDPEHVDVDLYPYKDYTPTTNDIYDISITEGIDKGYWSYDKFKLFFAGLTVNEGDTITLKYRSERNIYQWDVRDGDLKWVYENKQEGFDIPTVDEGGWYSFSYTFGKNDINGTAVAYPHTGFGVYFRGAFIAEDVFEIMDVKFNGEPVAISQETITSSATFEGVIKDHVWEDPLNYAVIFATGALGDSDKLPVVAKVEAGSIIDLSDLEDVKGECDVFTDVDKTQPVNKKSQVLEDGLKLYYTVK